MHIKKMKEKRNLKLFGGNPSQLSLIRRNQVYYTIKLKFFKDYCTDHEIVLYKREFESNAKNNVYYQALNRIFDEFLTEIIKGIPRPANGQAQKQEQKPHTNSTLSRLDFYNSFVCNAINSIDIAKKIREKSNIESIIGDNENDNDNKLDKVQGILTTHATIIKNAVNSCKVVINGNDFGGKNCLMYLIIDGSDQNDKKEYTEDDKKLREILTDSNPFCYLRECSIREYVFYNSIQLFVKDAKNNTYVLVANAPEVKSKENTDAEIKEAEVNMNQQNQAEQSNAQPVVPQGQQQEQPQGQQQEQPQGQQQEQPQGQQQGQPQEKPKEEKPDGEQEEPKEEKEEKEEKPDGEQEEQTVGGTNRQHKQGNASRSQTGKQKVQQQGNNKSQPKQSNTSHPQNTSKFKKRNQGTKNQGQQQGNKPKQPPKKQPNINRNIIFCKEPTKEPEPKEINNAKGVFKKCIKETINKLLEITKSIHINLDDNLRNKLTISLRYLNTNQH